MQQSLSPKYNIVIDARDGCPVDRIIPIEMETFRNYI